MAAACLVWILWHQTLSGWSPVLTTQLLSECESIATARNKQIEKEGVDKGGGAHATLLATCFPHTFDPRPKEPAQ